MQHARLRAPAALEHVGDDAVGHGLAVLRPGGAVLGGAARVVAERAVQQQQAEEGEEVEVGQRALAARRQAPEERGRQLWQVVEVPRQAPPACAVSLCQVGSLLLREVILCPSTEAMRGCRTDMSTHVKQAIYGDVS